jgi:O-antigen/teichoic acid export membrane protein
MPFILPALFGSGFSHAVGMSLILLPAGILHGLQWVTCRLWAARGRGTLLAVSFGTTLVVMIGLDFVLVPAEGGLGAAIASLISSAVGVAVAVAGHRRFAEGSASLRMFLPGIADVRRILTLPKAAWRRLGGASAT